VQITEHGTAREFLDATERYRSADPVRTNLLGSIAEGVVAGRTSLGETWLTVGDGDRIVGAALRTAPFNLVIGPMPVAAARRVGEHLRTRADELPGVTGPEEVVTALLAQWDRPWTVHMRDVLRVLERLVPPPVRAPGRPRRAGSSDRDLVSGWHLAFLREAGLPVLEDDPGAPRLESGGGSLWIWEAAGQPVCMAGHAPIVSTAGGTVARIGPVYTVPEHRGHGYAAAATAYVTELLLAECDLVMLFADAQNPTSNRVYERLGFASLGEQVEVTLG
jgi:predicted GNAT family acetyltransferase